MAERHFTLYTDPHVAHVGPHDLFFEPEVIGTEFVEAYTRLQQVQEEVTEATTPRKATATRHAKAIDLSAASKLDPAMRDFLAAFMLPESAELFVTLRLPQRVLVELIEFVTELYGGGSGNPDADGGSSDG